MYACNVISVYCGIEDETTKRNLIDPEYMSKGTMSHYGIN